jgi:hypothetical protein
VRYPKNKLIIAQREPSDAFFDLQGGPCKTQILSTQGKEAPITLLGKGDFMSKR